MEGQLLGNRYELIERIGGGGMAIVYKARCRLLNRYVAVKILRSEFTDDEEFVKRFRIEAQAAASLSHPNIVSIFDVGHDGNIHYIVMEYIDGITLKEYITRMGALPWREAVNIAIQICSAIEQAHKNHIVHRDIKPHNILITKEGIAKVTDFGIARAVTSATITMVGSTIGSVHYFSPEQARGAFTDEKSDLYSLGITIYEMVTGKVPFDGESPVAVALKHIQEKAERPADVNPAIPRGLNDLIVKAIKKDQNLRYPNASEMLSDLQRTLSEPNVQIAGSGAAEELPTRKMQAVGKDIDLADDEETEEEGEGTDQVKKRKKDRLSIWLGIATGLILAGIIFYIGMKVVIPAMFPEAPEEYIVLDYTNKNFSDVKSELAKLNINADDSERVYSDTIGENIIITQEVATGNKLKPGSTIRFKVSNGPELAEVPEVTGKELRIGEQDIRNNDLEVSEVQEYSETVGTGLIIRTEPAALEKIKPGETVTVFVSLGPELKKVKVPNLFGLTRSEAEKLIDENGLKIGKILPEDVVSEVAKIIKQYPLAETEVDEGEPIEITFDVGTTTKSTNGQTDPNYTSVGENTQSATTDNGTKMVKVTLDTTLTYGDQVRVYVEATPSDTNELQVIYSKTIAKSNFPLNIQVPLAKSGTTHIVVKLDDYITLEGDY
jgi:beta-lactam-binding protein with PASTA domain/tRNA A-37 threonylcarbamoyl transferase component Bud32